MNKKQFAPLLIAAGALLSAASAHAGPAPLGYSPHGSIDTDGLTHIIYVGRADQHVYEISMISGNWRWTDLTRLSGGPPVRTSGGVMAYARSDGLTAVVYQDSNDHIIELSAGTRWRSTDLTAASGAYPAWQGPINGYVRADGTNAVLFQAIDGPDLHELTYSGGRWRDTNISQAMNMPDSWKPNGIQVWNPAVSANGSTVVSYNVWSSDPAIGVTTFGVRFTAGQWSAFPVTWKEQHSNVWARADGTTALVSYGSVSPYKQHLFLQSLNSDTFYPSARVDLTNTVAAPLLAASPFGFTDSRGVDNIIYVQPNRHIELLYYAPATGRWWPNDLSAVSGAPLPKQTVLREYVRADGANAIPYQGNDDNIYEVYWAQNFWQWRNVTASATPQ